MSVFSNSGGGGPTPAQQAQEKQNEIATAQAQTFVVDNSGQESNSALANAQFQPSLYGMSTEMRDVLTAERDSILATRAAPGRSQTILANPVMRTS